MDVPVGLGIGAALVASVWNTFTASGAVYYDTVTMFLFFLTTARFIELLSRHEVGTVTEALTHCRPPPHRGAAPPRSPAACCPETDPREQRSGGRRRDLEAVGSTSPVSGASRRRCAHDWRRGDQRRINLGAGVRA
jgi:hypothetical protein